MCAPELAIEHPHGIPLFGHRWLLIEA